MIARCELFFLSLDLEPPLGPQSTLQAPRANLDVEEVFEIE